MVSSIHYGVHILLTSMKRLTVLSFFRGLNIKPPGEEVPPSLTNTSFRGCCPPVVHYAVSTSTSNPTRFYTRLPPPSSTRPHSWKIPNSGVCPDTGSGHVGSPGTSPGVRPSVLHQLDRTDRRSVKEEASELENFVHSHMVDPRSPLKSDCQPNSPAESSGCGGGGDPAASAKVHNWKKYKFIVLNENPSQNSSEPTRPAENRSVLILTHTLVIGITKIGMQ